MRNSWNLVRAELDRWTDGNLTARFWIRDDDAFEVSPQLSKLDSFAVKHDLGIGLAVIPSKVRSSLAAFLVDKSRRFYPMCHGWAHTNYGAPSKPAEFGPERSFPDLVADARAAFEVFCGYFGANGAIFVPPYNRIAPTLINALTGIGFAGLSSYPGFFENLMSRCSAQFNVRVPLRIRRGYKIKRFDVQIDPIQWKPTATARPDETIAMSLVGHLRLRRNGFLDADDPIGIMTHHLFHDDTIWNVCDVMVDVLRQHPAVKFVDVREIFNLPSNEK
jgi:hypothetical protein